MDAERSDRQKVLGLNALLKDVYGQDILTSKILAMNGFTDEHLATLRGSKLAVFLDRLQDELKYRFSSYSNGMRCYLILCRRYGLFEYESGTLQHIGDELGVSRERIRQLQEKALRRLKPTNVRDPLANLVVLAACSTLSLEAKDFSAKAKATRI